MLDVLSDLYIHEYPRLIGTLSRVRDCIKHDASLPVTLIAIFGSIARISPHEHSDTDLLILIAGASDTMKLSRYTTALVRIIMQAEDETVDEHYRWHIIPVLGDATTTDLDPDFVATIGREGVLLYQAPGADIPEPLRRLEPFEQWTERVRQMLDKLSTTRSPSGLRL